MNVDARRPMKARMGWPGYVRILATLRDRPQTITDLTHTIGCGRDTAYRVVPQLHSRGILHIESWRREPRKPLAPIYAYGPGDDAAPPERGASGRVCKAMPVLRPTVMSSELRSFADFLEALQDQLTINELVAECGADPFTVTRAVRLLMEAKLARIAGYIPRPNCGGPWMVQYVLGTGKNASRPTPELMRQQTQARWRDRRREATLLRRMAGGVAEQVRA